VTVGEARRFAIGAMIVLASATLVSCTGVPTDPAEPSSSTKPASAAPGPAPTAAADPELVRGGSADDNRAYFDFVNTASLADGNPGGRPVIDNLVAAGFDKAAMQVTADRTPRGSAVDSLQFSVRIDDDCLIGQADGGGYVSTVAPALESGACLVGRTRAIDW
jgi:hypothetical protein